MDGKQVAEIAELP